MSFVKFLANYADEALAIGKALTGVLNGLALSPKQAADVNAAIDKLQDAHDNILGSIDKVTTPVVKIEKKDIEDAVAKVLPKLVEAAVAKAMANAKTN